jgi:hypothetical protein
VVEFSLVTILLVFLFLAILQLAFALYVRNTLVAAAAEGARYGANADRAASDGAALTRRLIRDSLADSYAADVRAGHEDVGGERTVYVQVRVSLPLVGMLGPANRMVVRGHALEEAR